MPPRVAPQQVVVIPIPNAKMTGDDKQVPTFVIVFNNFVSTLCACATDCVALLCLFVIAFSLLMPSKQLLYLHVSTFPRFKARSHLFLHNSHRPSYSKSCMHLSCSTQCLPLQTFTHNIHSLSTVFVHAWRAVCSWYQRRTILHIA